ncbi:MAG: RNA polymerase sigma factor [Candidatus Methylomirabilis sp.]
MTAQTRAVGQHDDDLAAIERASAGDSAAFEALVRKYQGWVFTLAYRMLGDRADAEEMAQEIFLKAYRALERFERKSKFSTWLYSIATNHCLNQLESRRRRPRFQEISGSERAQGNPGALVEEVADPAPGPEQALEHDDVRYLVQQQLLRLTPEHRAILVLREIQGLAYDEIGELLGLAPGTVRSRLHRARMELKERLKPYR